MPDNHEVLAKLHQALEAATRCSTEETTVNYESLNEALQQLATLTKRIVQSSADGATLARKLRAGDPLTSDERVRLRLLIVGDADYYLKYDEEFERCKAELSKIVLELQRLQSGHLSMDTLMHLSVLCQEACSILVLTDHYVGQRDRVRKFEEAIRGPID